MLINTQPSHMLSIYMINQQNRFCINCCAYYFSTDNNTLQQFNQKLTNWKFAIH